MNRSALREMREAAYKADQNERLMHEAKSDQAKAKALKNRNKWLRRAQILSKKAGYEYGTSGCGR